MTKEFIININGEGFYIYSNSKDEALMIFQNMCKKYSNTSNINYKKYWNDIIESLISNKYILTENLNFDGVRKILVGRR